MKKTLFIVVIFALLLTMNSFGQNRATVNKYVNMMAKAKVSQSDLSGLGLPKIAGTWYFVDADDGNDNYNGLTPDKAFETVSAAYAACTTGEGDGIALLARTISGTSYSFSVGDGRLTWSKYGITMVGVSAPIGYSSRARIVNSTDGDSAAALILITGSNNTFINILFAHEPNWTTHTTLRTMQISAVQISGNRNAFINCHFACAPNVNTYAAYMSAINLRAGSDECVFDGCYFGSSSFDVGNNAASWIYLMGAAAQHRFRNCTFIQQVSAGTAFGAFETSGVTVMNGIILFEECTFAVWRVITHANICASWFIGTKPNTGNIGLRNCLLMGFTAIDAVGGNDVVWTNQPASNAAGGIGVTP